jgi:NDP-sugar pyrophosphorylase family protein
VGVESFVINTHHVADAYGRAFPDGKYGDASLIFRHEPVLLETGGGIKNVEDLLGDAPFIVYNGDILTNLPLKSAIAYHQASGNEVTLVLRSHGGPLQVALGHLVESASSRSGHWTTGRVIDIGNRLGRAPGTHLFACIYLIAPAFLRRLTLEKSSVIPAFLQIIEEGGRLGGIVLDEGEWRDLGTREQYLEAHRSLRAASPDANWIHPTARVHPTARITGATCIGRGAQIGPEVQLHDSILWDGTKIAEKSVLKNCIVTAGQTVSGVSTDADF